MREKRNLINELKCTFLSYSVNESLARSLASAFVCQANPTVAELADIKCAVSEAVTNCIVHAYPNGEGVVYIEGTLFEGNILKIKIRDRGVGISDIKQAMEPLYTTAGDDRSGLGFCVMESFSDKVGVRSTVGKGTVVTLTKKLSGKEKL